MVYPGTIRQRLRVQRKPARKARRGQRKPQLTGYQNGIPGLVNTSDPQPNWSWCFACQGLYWTGNIGVCAGEWNGTAYLVHAKGQTNYDMYFNTTGQAYWEWCTNCSLLYYQGNSIDPVGACPYYLLSGGGPHLGGFTIYDVGYAGTFS